MGYKKILVVGGTNEQYQVGKETQYKAKIT